MGTRSPINGRRVAGRVAVGADSDGVWRNVGAYGKKRVYSGGGSANRANARVNCSSFGEYYSYRSWVDVDIVGANDPSGVGYTPTRNLRCHL